MTYSLRPKDSQAVQFSANTYRRFLSLYPKSHRVEFGSLMAQLFRDQCRDAWKESRWWGLFGLWLRTIPDLLQTAFLEHLNNMKGKRFMFQKIPKSSRITFVLVAAAAFVLIYSSIVLTTLFLLPEKYASFVRLEVNKASTSDVGAGRENHPASSLDPHSLQTEIQIIESSSILNGVIKNLHLDEIFAKQLGVENSSLTMDETYFLLHNKRLKVQRLRGTVFIEVWVYNSDKNLASQIANEIASVYIKDAQPRQLSVKIRDSAKPGLRPVSPNLPMNLVLGFAISLALACMAGATLAFAVWLLSRARVLPAVKQDGHLVSG